MLRGISTHKKGKGKGFQQKPPNINLPVKSHDKFSSLKN